MPKQAATDYFSFDDEFRGDVDIRMSVPTLKDGQAGRRILTHKFEIEDPEDLLEVFRQAQFQIQGGELEQNEQSAELLVWQRFCIGVDGYAPEVCKDFKKFFVSDKRGRRHARQAANILVSRMAIREAATVRPLEQ